MQTKWQISSLPCRPLIYRTEASEVLGDLFAFKHTHAQRTICIHGKQCLVRKQSTEYKSFVREENEVLKEKQASRVRNDFNVYVNHLKWTNIRKTCRQLMLYLCVGFDKSNRIL